MDKRTYFLAVYKAEEGGYWGRFPDFHGVNDQGETLEETVINAKSMLNFAVKEMVDAGQTLPEPAEGEALLAKLDPESGKLFCMVPITVYPPAKTERISVTATGNKIAEITDYAKANKLSRSELMVNVTLEYIAAKV